VLVELLDGNGQLCAKLSGPASQHDFVFQLSQGRVEISGIRFGAVSSRHGGFFQLRVSLAPSMGVPVCAPWLSEKIQVLSYRLFHAPKVGFENLQPSDPLSKVKGIRSMYARRFAALGVVTVKDLAELDVQALQSGSEEAKTLLDSLRKDRGALTVARLHEYIVQARDTVRRVQDENSPSKEDPIGNSRRLCVF